LPSTRWFEVHRPDVSDSMCAAWRRQRVEGDTLHRPRRRSFFSYTARSDGPTNHQHIPRSHRYRPSRLSVTPHKRTIIGVPPGGFHQPPKSTNSGPRPAEKTNKTRPDPVDRPPLRAGHRTAHAAPGGVALHRTEHALARAEEEADG